MNEGFFQTNRTQLSEKLNRGLVIVTAASKMQRGNDAAYRFEQEANFWYLCGIEHADWTLVMNGSAGSSFLIAPDVDEVHEMFDGSLSHAQAKRISGIERVYSYDEGMRELRKLVRRHDMVYTVDQPEYADRMGFTLNPALRRNRQMLERLFPKVQSCTKELAQLRAIKQDAEIKAIQTAVKHTCAAFERIRQHMGDYKHEYEIEAEFSFAFRRLGLQGHAYDPIVAAGKNACTLHYGHNTDSVRSKQLVLMDVGARVNGYAADITRTYAKGEPTKRQRQVHGAVEAAHHRIIGLIEPMLAVERYQRSVEDIMKEALASIGLASDEAGLRRYFPHAISHGLGIDVHDSLGAPKYFQENMVLTVEPGIYIPEENIGVRIEDDILVTANGNKNLSAGLSTGL